VFQGGAQPAQVGALDAVDELLEHRGAVGVVADDLDHQLGGVLLARQQRPVAVGAAGREAFQQALAHQPVAHRLHRRVGQGTFGGLVDLLDGLADQQRLRRVPQPLHHQPLQRPELLHRLPLDLR
jgi:hypothetical protein